jgi:hypothetical protein
MTDELNPNIENVDLSDPREFRGDPAVVDSDVLPGLAPPLQPEEIPDFWRPKRGSPYSKIAEFNPDEIIETPEIDPAVLKDLVLPGAPPAEEARLQRDADFGQFKPEWVQGVSDTQQTHRRPVVAGEYRFKVQQHRLKDALDTTKLTVGAHTPLSKVKVTLFRTRLRVHTCNQRSFSEFTLPLEEPSPSPTEQEEGVTFIFEHELLLRITERLPRELAAVEFTYVVATQRLTFQTFESAESPVVQRDFRLACWPLWEFTSYGAPIPLPASPVRVNSFLLCQAVRYTALFAREDETGRSSI